MKTLILSFILRVVSCLSVHLQYEYIFLAPRGACALYQTMAQTPPIIIAGPVDLRAHGGRLVHNGVPFQFKGINWPGMETSIGVPLGLSQRSATSLLQWVAQEGFNAVRLHFNWQDYHTDRAIPKAATHASPELAGATYRELLVRLTRIAASNGLLVVLACSRIKRSYGKMGDSSSAEWPAAWDGLWYDRDFSELRLQGLWEDLAGLFCGEDNIAGVDLMSEPHAARWGSGRSGLDWDGAASRLGDSVLGTCPRWLIFVQGIADPGQWGENLMGARQHPVHLLEPAKLVYSPHLYGPSFFGGSPSSLPVQFRSSDFPTNLVSEWDALWGYLAAEGVAPVVIGEAGGDCQGRDEIWHRALVAYLKSRGCGLFYASLSPENPKIGGLLAEDWTTPDRTKLDVLGNVPATPVRILARGSATQWALAANMMPPPALSPRSRDAQLASMCGPAGALRDLRHEHPPQFCYHLNDMGRAACESRFVSSSDGLQYRCAYSMTTFKCNRAPEVLPCSPPAPPPGSWWSYAPAKIAAPPVRNELQLPTRMQGSGAKAADDGWQMRSDEMVVPEAATRRSSVLPWATGLVGLLALTLSISMALQPFRCSRARRVRHTRLSTADDDEDVSGDDHLRIGAQRNTGSTPRARSIRADELEVLETPHPTPTCPQDNQSAAPEITVTSSSTMTGTRTRTQTGTGANYGESAFSPLGAGADCLPVRVSPLAGEPPTSIYAPAPSYAPASIYAPGASYYASPGAYHSDAPGYGLASRGPPSIYEPTSICVRRDTQPRHSL